MKAVLRRFGKYLSAHTSYVSRRLDYSVSHRRAKTDGRTSYGTRRFIPVFAGTRWHIFMFTKARRFVVPFAVCPRLIASYRRARGLISVLTGARGFSNLFIGARKLIAVFTGHRRFITIVTEVNEKSRICKSHWLRRGTRMNNSKMAKIMLNYRPTHEDELEGL